MNQVAVFKRILFSEKESEVIDVLRKLRDVGYPELIPDLFLVYIKSQSDEIKMEVLYLLNNMKVKEAVPMYIKGLNQSLPNAEMAALVASCWQCGLDFSTYLEFFFPLVATKDFAIAFEAFTVIENNLAGLKHDDRNRYLHAIQCLSPGALPENKALVDELKILLT